VNDDIFKAMAQSIIDGESEEAAELAQKSIEQDIDPLDAINKGFILGVNHVGDEFSVETLLTLIGNGGRG